MTPPSNKGKKIATKRTADKNERLRFVAGLLRKGIPVAQVYRVICEKYGVGDRTAAKYFRELGGYAATYMNDEAAIEAEICAALDRLKGRAQRDDSVGNTADQIILNLMGVRSFAPQKKNLDAQRARIEQARADLIEAQAQVAKTEAEKAVKVAARESRWGDEFVSMLQRIRDNRSASVKDVLHLTCLFLENEIAKGPDANMRQVLSTLRHLTKISMIDPSGMGTEHQLFTLPEGMALAIAPDPDDGDDLIE